MRAGFEYGLALVAAFLLGGAIAVAMEWRERALAAEAWVEVVGDEVNLEMNNKEQVMSENMEAAAHSPLPWRIEKNLYGTANIIETDGRQVAACSDGVRSFDPAAEEASAKLDEANAAYIVECVNSHERLVAEVARLKDALCLVAAYGEQKGWNVFDGISLDVRNAIRTAIGEEAWND